MVSGEVLSALGGAAVAFAGSGALQHARFRREDLVRVRDGLTAARSMIYQLRVVVGDLDGSLQRGTRPAVLPFPAKSWTELALPLMPVLYQEHMDKVVHAFSRIEAMNSLIAVTGPKVGGDMNLDLGFDDDESPPIAATVAPDGPPERPRTLRAALELLRGLVLDTQSILEQVEHEYVERERQLAHPWRTLPDRIRRRPPQSAPGEADQSAD